MKAQGPEGRVTTATLSALKRAEQKIVMTTAYDALFASIVDRAGVDIILVGDSVGPVLAGEETTVPVTLDQMVYHGRCVSRGVARALVVVDLPFLSYQVSVREAVRNAGQVLKETRAPAVKLEGGKRWAPTVDALVTAGIPVMGHIGLTPQSLHVAGEIKVQGRDDQAAERLVEDALCLQEAGAFAIVLEFVSAVVAQRISQAVEIPTIGIGAGPHCDGQVLVLYDLLGFGDGPRGKFVKRYAELEAAVEGAVTRFADEVRGRAFPDEAHTHR